MIGDRNENQVIQLENGYIIIADHEEGAFFLIIVPGQENLPTAGLQSCNTAALGDGKAKGKKEIEYRTILMIRMQ